MLSSHLWALFLHTSPPHRGQEQGQSVSLAFPFHSPCKYRIKLCVCLAHTSSRARGKLLSLIYSLLQASSSCQVRALASPCFRYGKCYFTFATDISLEVFRDVQQGTPKGEKVACLERCFDRFLNELQVIWEFVMWGRNGFQPFSRFLQCLFPSL